MNRPTPRPCCRQPAFPEGRTASCASSAVVFRTCCANKVCWRSTLGSLGGLRVGLGIDDVFDAPRRPFGTPDPAGRWRPRGPDDRSRPFAVIGDEARKMARRARRLPEMPPAMKESRAGIPVPIRLTPCRPYRGPCAAQDYRVSPLSVRPGRMSQAAAARMTAANLPIGVGDADAPAPAESGASRFSSDPPSP